MSADLDKLIERARRLPPPTRDQEQEMALGFAYGNLACSTNHRPDRAAFEAVARERYGWTTDRFNRWADRKEWAR